MMLWYAITVLNLWTEKRTELASGRSGVNPPSLSPYFTLQWFADFILYCVDCCVCLILFRIVSYRIELNCIELYCIVDN